MKLPNGFGTVYKMQGNRRRPRLVFLILRLRLISDALRVLASTVCPKRLTATDTAFRNFEIVHI